MIALDKAQDRVDILQNQLDRQLADIEILEGRLQYADGQEYRQVVEDLALAKMKTDIMRQAVSKAEDDLEAAEVHTRSQDHKDAVKKMDSTKKDIDKITQAIDDTYQDLRSQLLEFKGLCDSYDSLAVSRGVVSPSARIRSHYQWPSYLYNKMITIRPSDNWLFQK